MYIGYRWGGIATTGYNAQIHDLLNGRQLVARAVYCRDREGQVRYITRLSDVHNPGSCCCATKVGGAGYGVDPVIAVDMDTGYDGCCVASTTGNYSAIQDLLSGWCYAGADREGPRGGYTWCLYVHNAGRCCRATTGRCAGYSVLPMIADCMDIGDRRCGIADTCAAGNRA